MTNKILVIDKQPSRVNYEKIFGFPVDVANLCSEKVQRVLKSNMTIDTDIIFDYEYVILIGAEPLKVFSQATAITEHTGKRVKLRKHKLFEGKEHNGLIACVNPAMMHFKPEIKPVFEQSLESITTILTGGEKEKAPVFYKPITTEEEALAYIDELGEYISSRTSARCGLDSEASAFYPRDGYILGFSFSHMTHQGVYIHADAVTDLVAFRMQKEVFDNPKWHIALHNAKFDIKFFVFHFGWSFNKAFDENRLHDTMLLHYVLDERRGTHGLKSLVLKYTDMGDYEAELEEFKEEYCRTHKLTKEQFSYDLIPFETMWSYGCGDTDGTLRLFNKFLPIVEQNPKLSSLYYNVMLPGLRFLAEMEDRGVPLHRDRLLRCKEHLYKKIERLNTELYAMPEVIEYEKVTGKVLNPGSPVQLRTLLFDIAGITPLDKYTATNQLSTDAEVLAKLGETHKIAKILLDIRKATKILNTYIIKMLDNIDKDGCLRTGFSQHTTTSGRLSSSGKLNLQQLPRDDAMVKGCIVAPEGYKVVAVD
jgi:DNA polymerase I-like protein with 3'-5' exonuclease and polymerase domains